MADANVTPPHPHLVERVLEKRRRAHIDRAEGASQASKVNCHRRDILANVLANGIVEDLAGERRRQAVVRDG